MSAPFGVYASHDYPGMWEVWREEIVDGVGGRIKTGAAAISRHDTSDEARAAIRAYRAGVKPFHAREVSVTMTGAEWTALLAFLTYAKTPRGLRLFSKSGLPVFKRAKTRLATQLTAASDTKETKLEVVR